MADTVKSYQYAKAPRRIALLGDKTKRPESAQHIIEFPGGAVELTRTSTGDYWVHVIVNREQIIDDADGRVSAFGRIVDARIDRVSRIDHVPELENVEQIAFLVHPERRA